MKAELTTQTENIVLTQKIILQLWRVKDTIA